MSKGIGFEKLTLGTCYYPEHWDEELWESDLIRMEEHGIKIIRIAEFAWNIFEPTEGLYRFDFFDSFLKAVGKHDIKVIFATPTATPPAWLTEKYPEVLNAKTDGTLFHHGMRRHYNYNSPKYNELTRKIVAALAKHYGQNPTILGWQIDNELNCAINTFYSESDHQAFRTFLQDKYITLDALNKAWGTNFWSQTYTDWGQVHLKRPNVRDSQNPHMALDEKRFISRSCIRYCKLQFDILRKHISPGQFITTNGLFGHIDYQEMVEVSLDFITYDSYPNSGLSRENIDGLKDRKWSFNLSRARSICPTFGVMEQQSGSNGWVDRMCAPNPEPGQMRLWTFQSIAHGADYVSYFRWRTCSFGTELYWHGLNDHSNLPNRRMKELMQIKGDVYKTQDIAMARYQASFALLREYDNEWDGEMDVWHGPLTKQSERGWFEASTYSHTPMDLLYLNDRITLEMLSHYKMLVYPHPAILSEKTASLLKTYVENGGILIVGARTGYKNEYGHCPMHALPGYARPICGVQVSDFTMLTQYNSDISIQGDETFEAIQFADILMPITGSAKVIGVFHGGYFDGQPAIVENTLGRGKALYFGSAFTHESAEKLLAHFSLKSPWLNYIKLPDCCELAVREKEGNRFIFVLNYGSEKTTVSLKISIKDLLSGKKLKGDVALDGYGVLVLSTE